MGTVIAMPISGFLCKWFGWESVFYVFGMDFLLSVLGLQLYFLSVLHHYFRFKMLNNISELCNTNQF
jgi:predicted MFS family arabinose efflux permease